MSEPLVSVVMPVYNAGRYLIDAISSFLGQTFHAWELICIDDGSNDGSGQLLDWFVSQDSRIRVVHQANLGIVGALNRGCELAVAPLICRMDGDDIAVADRLAKQTAFLRRSPNCVAVGGAILEIDSDGDRLCESAMPTTHLEIESNLLHRRTGLFHPTVMMRTEAFRSVGGYRSEFQWVEDHDLWLRMAGRGQLANLSDIVLCYRQHGNSICWQRSQQQRELMNRLLRDAYAQRGLEVPDQLVLRAAASRSIAGPGKWARKAAKGGYPTSVAKHLKQLAVQTAVSRRYKSRLFAESFLRLFLGYPRRLLCRNSITVPRFEAWHSRATEVLRFAKDSSHLVRKVA